MIKNAQFSTNYCFWRHIIPDATHLDANKPLLQLICSWLQLLHEKNGAMEKSIYEETEKTLADRRDEANAV